jgi:hypothetical protein
MAASKKQVGGDHYCRFAIQPSEFIHQNQIDWLSGNIIKYACRHQDKGGPEDVKKIIHYAELLLEWEYGDPEKKTDEELGVDNRVDELWDWLRVSDEDEFLSVLTKAQQEYTAEANARLDVDSFMEALDRSREADEIGWKVEDVFEDVTADDLVEALMDMPTPDLNDAVERLVEEQEFRERVLRSSGRLI